MALDYEKITSISHLHNANIRLCLDNYSDEEKKKIALLCETVHGNSWLLRYSVLVMFCIFACMEMPISSWKEEFSKIEILRKRFGSVFSFSDAVDLYLAAKGVKFNVESPFEYDLEDFGKTVYLLKNEENRP